jgi:hypothetical protein
LAIESFTERGRIARIFECELFIPTIRFQTILLATSSHSAVNLEELLDEGHLRPARHALDTCLPIRASSHRSHLRHLSNMCQQLGTEV